MGEEPAAYFPVVPFVEQAAVEDAQAGLGQHERQREEQFSQRRVVELEVEIAGFPVGIARDQVSPFVERGAVVQGQMDALGEEMGDGRRDKDDSKGARSSRHFSAPF